MYAEVQKISFDLSPCVEGVENGNEELIAESKALSKMLTIEDWQYELNHAQNPYQKSMLKQRIEKMKQECCE